MPVVVISFLAAFGLLCTFSWLPHQRRPALHALLSRAEMFERVAQARRRPEDAPSKPAHSELEIDLMYAELSSGYLQHCVYRPHRVTQMRELIAYVEFMRLIGARDRDIEQDLLERAGPDRRRLAQLLGYAGLDGIDHFICFDYLRAALAAGLSPRELRGFIDTVPDKP